MRSGSVWYPVYGMKDCVNVHFYLYRAICQRRVLDFSDIPAGDSADFFLCLPLWRLPLRTIINSER